VQVVDERLAAGSSAPASARAALRRGVPGDTDSATTERLTLIASELVANCVLHAGLGPDQTIALRVHRTPRRWRVEVEDPGRGFHPHQCPACGPCERHGLRIVAGLAARWGLESGEPTLVWVEVGDAPAPGRPDLRLLPPA
jgi:anti-sigma regulatory factor (Ser/Thr protein kinase)